MGRIVPRPIGFIRGINRWSTQYQNAQDKQRTGNNLGELKGLHATSRQFHTPPLHIYMMTANPLYAQPVVLLRLHRRHIALLSGKVSDGGVL
jgi:hypothetical protein